MFTDPYLLITVGSEFLLMLLGAVVSLQEDWAKTYRRYVFAAFALVGISGMCATIKTAQQSAVANSQLSTSIADLGKSTAEISRVTALNTSLQEKLLAQSSGIAALAEESFRTITGADSFPYIVPERASYPGPISLFVWDHGKYPLTAVTLTIRRSDDFNLFQPPLDVGILHPGWGKPLLSSILPKPDSKTGEDVFLIEMYTQSDFFTEVLHFRKSKDGNLWAYKFWVDKSTFGEITEPRSYLPKIKKAVPAPKNGSLTFPVYDRSQWSDELPEVKSKGK
jgi:hypothetical protein